MTEHDPKLAAIERFFAAYAAKPLPERLAD